jgi:hypothetical protein
VPRAAAARLAIAAALLAGCGVPGSLEKQAEEVESVAAEGALLAQGAADGDSTAAFTRVHARDLRERVRQLEPAIRDRRLTRLARDTEARLARLENRPADRSAAREVEQALTRAADAASEIASQS